MKAFKYMMIDVRRTKAQVYCMFLFGFMAYFFADSAQSMVSGIIYLVFAATLMQGAAFTYEQKQETGFVNMLPGTDLERSTGRFLMGGFLLGIGILVSALVAVALNIKENMNMVYLPEMLIGAMGFGLMFIAFQNVLFYAIGKGNSQQAMSFIHMIPGFVLLVASTTVRIMFPIAGEDEQGLLDILLWIKENVMSISIVTFLLGIIFSVLGIIISAKIISKKDFA